MDGASKVKICGLTRAQDAVLAVDLGAWAVGMVFYDGSPRRCGLIEAEVIARTLRRRAEICGVFVNESLDRIATVADALKLSIVQLHGDEGPAFCAEVGRRTGAKVCKAVRVSAVGDVRDLERFHVDFHLVDAGVRRDARHADGRASAHVDGRASAHVDGRALAHVDGRALAHAHRGASAHDGGRGSAIAEGRDADAGAEPLFGGSGKTFDWSLLRARHAKTPLILSGGLTPQNVAGAIETVRPFAVDVASGVEAAPGIKDEDKLRAFFSEAARRDIPEAARRDIPVEGKAVA